MTLVTGKIVEVDEDGGYRMGKVSVDGAVIRVPLMLVPDARLGDVVLMEGGVAVGVVTPGSTEGG